MEKVGQVELAWAAGFFDGEGSSGSYPVRKDRPYLQTCAQISQKDRRVLDRFRNAVGYGHILKHSKGCWRWMVTGAPETNEVMVQLFPYLSEIKQEQWVRAWEKRWRRLDK